MNTQRRVPPLLAYLLIAAGLLGGIGKTISHTLITDFPVDMIIYREGVKAFLSGGEVYSQPMYAGDITLPFIYPPFGALVMVPLVAFESMSDDLAGDIMIVLSDLLLLACIYLVARAILPAMARRNFLAVVFVVWAVVLGFEPVELNNGFAQINIAIMALVVFDLVPRKRYLPQGWLIGVAAAIKLTPAAMLLYFLVRKDAKPIITAAVSGVVATALAAAVRWDVFVEFFFGKMLAMGSGDDFGVGTAYQSNSSWKGVLERAFSSAEAAEAHSTFLNVAWLIGVVVIIGVGAWLMRGLFRRGLDIDAALTATVVMLLISPVSWSHHWVWLTLILQVLAYRAWSWRHQTWVAGSLIAVVAAWAFFLLTVPPKWWFGDDIDVYGLNSMQKFLVSDFVWLIVIAGSLYAYCALQQPRRELSTESRARGPVSA